MIEDEGTLPNPIWVNTPAALQALASDLARQSIIAVDTESNSLHAFREQVCLIQFSTPRQDYVLDPLALSDLSPLGPIFASPAIEKIFHAAEYDLICLKRDFNFCFENLFDTMHAGRILGREGVGLSAMIEAEFGIALNKHYQRADWGMRPLSPEMLAYARLDTHYLIALRGRLRAALQAQSRWELAQEDFNRFCHAPCTNHTNGENNDALWRFPGVQQLEPQQVSILQELCHYREACARELNRPPFKVFSNQGLLEIAQVRPHFVEELRLLPSLSERQVRKYGRHLLEAVQRGRSLPPPRRPAPHMEDERVLARMERLKEWRKMTGKQLGVESDVVLPKDILYTISITNPQNLEQLSALMIQTPWRFQQYGAAIMKVLNKSA